MANESVGILLQLILDKAKAAEVESAVEGLTDGFKELARSGGKTDKEVKALEKDFKGLARATVEAEKGMEKLDAEFDQTITKVRELDKASQSIGQASQGLFLTGSAIVGSIFLSANNEAKRIEEAGGVVDETTKKWLIAQQRIQLSYQRIGRVSESAILPLLEKAAALAEKGSKFVEDHPDLVKAALNVGAVVATVGAVGMLVSKGVRFIADITLIGAQLKYAASTAMFKASVDKYMVATGKNALGGGAGAASGALGKAGAMLGNVTILATAVILGAEIGKSLGNAISKAIQGPDYKEQGFGDAFATYMKMISIPIQALAVLLNKLGLVTNDEAYALGIAIKKGTDYAASLDDASNSVDGLTDGLDELSLAAKKAESETKGAKIMSDLNKENIAAEKKYATDRVDIIRKSGDEIHSAFVKLAQDSEKIKATLSNTLSTLAANFAQAEAQAAAQYQQQYASIVQSGNEEILSIRKNAEEELRQLEEDFAEQKDELTRSRDALGLVKAERDHDKQKKEIERNRDEAIAESRRQTKMQLAELKRSFEQERADRLAKYQQDVADAQAQAAVEQAQAKAEFDARIAEIDSQKAQELLALRRAFEEERKQRILAAYAQIADLGTAANAERAMRQRYYDVILADATAFMGSYQNALSPGAVPGMASGGPVNSDGMRFLHKGEHVLSPGTTSAIGSLIGGQVSQQALMSALAFGGGRASFSLNDSRRFDSSIPLSERRAIENAATEKALNIFAELVGRKKR